MPKIGFSLQSSYALPMLEIVSLLRDIGLDAISPLWQRDIPLKDTANAARRCGLTLQSLHAPFRGLPEMWSREAPIVQELLTAADDCAEFGIPVLVVHSWGGLNYTFREEALYFGNFDCLVERAQANDIQIAFENLEGPEYLHALLERYKGLSSVGLCWDSGHELCYTPNHDFLQEYGHRLLVTHLNDNLGITDPGGQLRGTDDLHLIPFDGIAHWENTMHRLRQVRKQDILNFELKIRPKGNRCTCDLYSQLPLEQYFTKAYQQACRAAAGYFDASVEANL